MIWQKRLPRFGKHLENLLTDHILGAIEMSGELWREQIKRRLIHGLPFLYSSFHRGDFLIGKIWRAACFLFLHGGARLICIGAEYAAVSAFVDMCHGTRLTD